VKNGTKTLQQAKREVVHDRPKPEPPGSGSRQGWRTPVGRADTPAEERPKLTQKLLGKGRELRAQGMGWQKIGAELGLDEGTVRKALKGEAESKSGS
jgi:hypothetical protein